ncbi:MAG TPA: twin-arginine translocation signal domain-containing protein, partial [Kiloniellaceae bacterium]
MDSYLKYLGREAALGRISRREFLGRAAVVGLTLPFATTLLSSSLLAAGPQRGGHLKVGLQGGASTDVLDPDKCTSQVCFMTGRNWGDTLIESHPTSGEPVPALAESWSASPDAKVWTF